MRYFELLCHHHIFSIFASTISPCSWHLPTTPGLWSVDLAIPWRPQSLTVPADEKKNCYSFTFVFASRQNDDIMANFSSKAGPQEPVTGATWWIFYTILTFHHRTIQHLLWFSILLSLWSKVWDDTKTLHALQQISSSSFMVSRIAVKKQRIRPNPIPHLSLNHSVLWHATSTPNAREPGQKTSGLALHLS